MHLYRLIVFIAAFIVFISCSEGNYLLVGAVRDEITPNQVALYEQEPVEYEVIAHLAAKAKNSASYQKKLDYAIKKLKSQAASIGANGILLERIDEVTASPRFPTAMTKGAYSGSSETQLNVKGKAIFVPSKQTD